MQLPCSQIKSLPAQGPCKGVVLLGDVLEVRLRSSGCGKLTVMAWLLPVVQAIFSRFFFLNYFKLIF